MGNSIRSSILNNMLGSALMLGFCASLFTSFNAVAESADRDKPIELEADTVTVNDAKKTSTYTGKVILTQGTLVIHADKLIVREDKEGFQHSTSTGNPTTFKQKREGSNEYMQGSAQRIEYDGRMDKVQLYTRAWVKRGEDIVYGDYISYDANAEYAEVIGGVKSESSSSSSGRVKAIIQPKNKPAANPASTNDKSTNDKSSALQINTNPPPRVDKVLRLSPAPTATSKLEPQSNE